MSNNLPDIHDDLLQQEMIISEDLFPRKPKFTMHMLFVMLTLMLVASLIFVLGLEYFYDLSSNYGEAIPSGCSMRMINSSILSLCYKG